MGINKADDDLGRESPVNGYDSIYRSHTYRDYLLNKRPKNVSAKRFVVFLSCDILAVFTLLGIIDKLTTTKEIIVLIVVIGYAVVRLAISIVKFFAFVGRNREGIKNGIKTIRELFNE